MIKLECSIIRDLLPLYTEGVTSPETTEYVKNHLAACPECAAVAAELAAPLPPLPEADAMPLTVIQRKLKHQKLLAVLTTALFVAALLLGAFSFVTAPEHLPYAPDLISVAQQADGTLRIDASRGELYIEHSGESIYYLSLYESLWSRWFTDEKPFHILSDIPPEGSIIYYAQHNGSQDQLLYGDITRLDGTPVLLPRLALGYYSIIALAALCILTIAWLVCRKSRFGPWIIRILLLPASYLAAQLAVSGFRTVSYTFSRAFTLTVLIGALLYGALLSAYEYFRRRKA